MESKRTWILTLATAVGSILLALAQHGKAAVDALAGVPLLLQAYAQGLPLGIWSFFLSLALAILVWATAMAKLPARPDGRSPRFTADALALCTALGVTVTQQWFSSHKAPELIGAIWIGLFAGLLAPFLAGAVRALTTAKEPKP